MIGGVSCVPARSFVLNELTTMVPQAVRGKGWYKKRFGEEKIGNRGALVPGII
jgi:3-oxo-5-alpha-steroid 4-dehydrogenase 1